MSMATPFSSEWPWCIFSSSTVSVSRRYCRSSQPQLPSSM